MNFSFLLIFHFIAIYGNYCTLGQNHKQPIDTELDEDSDNSVEQHEQNPGVDDGFFVGTRPEPEDTDDNKHFHNHNNHIPNDNILPFPFAPGFNPNVVSKLFEQFQTFHLWNNGPFTMKFNESRFCRCFSH